MKSSRKYQLVYLIILVLFFSNLITVYFLFSYNSSKNDLKKIAQDTASSSSSTAYTYMATMKIPGSSENDGLMAPTDTSTDTGASHHEIEYVTNTDRFSLSNEYKSCMDNAMTTLSMGDCFIALKPKYDSYLDKVYTALFNRLIDQEVTKDEANSAINNVKDSFIKYRNDKCIFTTISPESGSDRVLYYASCYMGITEEHIHDLLCSYSETGKEDCLRVK